MTNNQETDPFASLNLEEFRNEKTVKESIQPEQILSKEDIRAIAEENHFHSREAASVPQKQKVVTKTFSLFQDECSLINRIIKIYSEQEGLDAVQPSGSDIVRAALHSFMHLSDEDKAHIIKRNRGRGRK